MDDATPMDARTRDGGPEELPPRKTALGIVSNVVILVFLFLASRLVRALWSPVAGDIFYWLLAFYVLVYLASWRVDLFRRIRNPDTSFMLNMVVRSAASLAMIAGLRIATAPLVTQIVKLAG